MQGQDWKPFTLGLIGSWPSQVNSWGRETIAAYVAELEARGVSPDAALVAIRSSDGEFPPSAGKLAAAARTDPSAPTFDELLGGLYAPGGVVRALWSWTGEKGERIARERLEAEHELVRAFVANVSLEWLRNLDPREGQHEFAGADRRKLEASWREFVETADERHVHALVMGGRRGGGLQAVDPARSIAQRIVREAAKQIGGGS